MDKHQLIGILKKNRYSADSYSIDEVKNESLCMLEEHGCWVIFYSEKGQRSDPKYYDNETDACSEFLREYQEMMDHL
ncbi:hypothetical protein ACQYRI_03080 [Salmonella enterica]